MPKLNLDFGSPARAHLLEAAQYWLNFGVDGYRLDHANGPDRAFWVDFRRACREVKPDAWLFAEVVMPPDAQASYLGSFDGTLDFMTCEALRESFARHSWEIAHLDNYLESYPKQFPANFYRPSIIDNHDMNSFLFTAEGSQKALHATLSLLYMMPGQPIIYAGTEQNISQAQSIHEKGSMGFDECRLPMDWSEPETETLLLIKNLNHQRSKQAWLKNADWTITELDSKNNAATLEARNGQDCLEISISLKAGHEQVHVKHCEHAKQ